METEEGYAGKTLRKTFSCEHESSTFDLHYLCFPKKL